MTTDITPRTGSALVVATDQHEWTDQQLAALKQLGVEDASPGDLAVFLHQVQRTGLDPFARQVYMVGRNTQNQKTRQWETKYTIQTGIDGFRLIGRRAADRARETLEVTDTEWCGKDGRWVDVWLSDEPPAAARVAVIRNGGRFPGLALFHEYAQYTRDGQLTKMWREKAALMIAKCAEALAWRRAYPQDLSGIYTADEMGQADNPTRQTQPRPTSIQEAVQQQQEAAPAEAADDVRTEAQATMLATLIRENGLAREEALPYFGSLVGREVASTKELTKAEASVVIDALMSATKAGVDPRTGEVDR